MSKLKFLTGLSRTLHKTGFIFKKHSPEILITAGAVGVVTGAVMACKATTKLETVMETGRKNVEAIHYIAENPEEMPDSPIHENPKKAIAMAYAHTGFELVKLYGPSVFVGFTSLGMMLASNNIMRKRYSALAAAYTIVDNNFKAYRGRVVERFGEELDKELRYNIKTKEVEEEVVDEKGKKKKVKKTIQVAETDEYSDFTKCFDESCPGWTKDPEANLTFLKIVQAQANDRLQREGYLFLNDVYEMLGFPRTRAGQAVGWMYKPNDLNFKGDNHVDFNIYDALKRNANFVNGYERSIWLDFNVDGPILHLINE